MQLQEEKAGDVFIITISDHLDSATAGTFEQHILGALDRGERKVLVDCSRLAYVNSAGLKVFLLAAKKLETLGGALALCALTPNVLMIFETIGFTRIINIVPTREDGLRAVSGETAPA